MKRIYLSIVVLLLPITWANAQGGLSPDTGGAPVVLPIHVESSTPKPADGIPPVKHPDGPKCDPGTKDCDITMNPQGLPREDAEANNELSTFFWDGVTLLSPLWSGAREEAPELVELYGKANSYELSSIQNTVTGDLRALADDLLKNVFSSTLFETESGKFRKSTLDEVIPVKIAPGLLPLGWQYEVDGSVVDALKAARAETEFAWEDKQFTSSYKYLLQDTVGGNNLYINDISRPLFSDTLERQWRIAADYVTRAGKAVGDFVHTPLFVADKESIGTFNQTTNWANQWFFFSHWTTHPKPYTVAVQECIRRGGHLPSLEELIVLNNRGQFPSMQGAISGEVVDMFLTNEFTTIEGSYGPQAGQVRVVAYAPYVQRNSVSTRAFHLNINTNTGEGGWGGIDSGQDFNEQWGVWGTTTFKPLVRAVCIYD